ncbi:hypothetical protein JOD69_004469 [Methylocaldum sp. RMAD-M]|jgi:hypothetical protein|nr:hypothetical protein [Methylocaldum sp. RMAD-M]
MPLRQAQGRLRRAFDKPVLSRVEGPVLSEAEGLTANGTNTLPFVLRLSKDLIRASLTQPHFRKLVFPLKLPPLCSIATIEM